MTSPSAGRPVVASQVLAAPLAATADWLADPANLPRWTGFFVEVRPDQGRHIASTPLGEAEVWIERSDAERGQALEICTILRGRAERARLVLEDAAGQTRASFRVNLLGEPDEDRVLAQQQQMTQELGAIERAMGVSS